MSSVRILTETPDTVTVSRADWLRLLQELEDAEDRAAVRERRTREELLGKDAARRDYLTAAEALRLIDGESPVRIWREKRGLSQRGLAHAASVSSSYLAEIETGRKPGSAAALRQLAAVLQVPAEDLVSPAASEKRSAAAGRRTSGVR
jgi:ribosome-binding protein aMBF1 (putative translation factor)